MPLALGDRIAGRYEVVRAIKSGGMGAVYECRDQRLANGPCALKEILEGAVTGPDAEYVEEKFKAEVEALVKLDHPGIPKVRDFFRLEKVLYIVMDYVAGPSLDDELADCQRLSGRPLDPEVVAGDTLQVLEILVYLHGRQMLHRDVKPSNLVRDSATGRVKLVDFGLARSYGGQEVMTMVGTPGYSAPEQLAGRAEPRSDLYALGVTMHHLLTGLSPRMLDLQPLQQHMPDYRPGLAAIVNKATRPKASERYENAETMLAALREWWRGEQARRAAGPETAREVKAPEPVQTPPSAPVPVPAWVPGLVLGVLGLGLGLLLGTRPPSPQAAAPPTSTPLPVALVGPPVAPSVEAPISQPDYNVHRPVVRPTPKPRVVPTPRPVVRREPTPVPVVPAQPAYPTAHKRPKPEATPTPPTPPPEPERIGAAFSPPEQRQRPISAEEALEAHLPPGFAIDFTGLGAVIHPQPPGGPGDRRPLRVRPQIRANVRCLDVATPPQEALDVALRQMSQRFPNARPLVGLGPDERGVQSGGPGAHTMFALVKTKPLGTGTRLCMVEGGVNLEGLQSLPQISRGLRLR